MLALRDRPDQVAARSVTEMGRYSGSISMS
jgi:hypothetical protein